MRRSSVLSLPVQLVFPDSVQIFNFVLFAFTLLPWPISVREREREMDRGREIERGGREKWGEREEGKER